MIAFAAAICNRDMKAYGFRDILFALLLSTRRAHTTAIGNITHEVHRTRRRRIKLPNYCLDLIVFNEEISIRRMEPQSF